MKNQKPQNRSDQKRDKMKNPNSNMIKKKKNQQRLGGGGLSLQVFANAKSRDNGYNPAIIKKQREFYKNAKCVNKYKKSLKQQPEPQYRPSFDPTPNPWDLLEVSTREHGDPKNPEGCDEAEASGDIDKNFEKKKKKKLSLEKLYESKRQEKEKARSEREALFQAKKEARERTESERKALRAKMYKKTRSGQPIMKHRIEHLLQSLQGNT